MNKYLNKLFINTVKAIYKIYILVFRFDKQFYLVCNPDVKNAHLDSVYHFRKYGFNEQRVVSLKECHMVAIERLNLDEYQGALLFKLNDLKTPESYCSLVLVPWRPGCWGRPNQFIRIILPNYLAISSVIVNLENILYIKKGIYQTTILVQCKLVE